MQKHNKLGTFLRDLRARLGLTQERFAVDLGFSFPTVSRWERGKSKPHTSTFTILSQYVERVGSEHPDLLARFRREISPPMSASTKAARSDVIIFQFQGNGDLRKCVQDTGQALQELARRADSGDADARKRLRVASKLINSLDAFKKKRAKAHRSSRRHRLKRTSRRSVAG
jgi:transcriptional regulator with XRE-family HTH domain